MAAISIRFNYTKIYWFSHSNSKWQTGNPAHQALTFCRDL
ncbi:hypothetical protein P20652_2804 [Pseudoalteromonas sp. BSi20652]|nr:hypothetical protein P20652_2804 [Pseudoalteromonas sp. BSi20652]